MAWPAAATARAMSGRLLDVLADHEKCGVDVVPRQHIEQVERVRVVGAVVEGESEPAGGAVLRR